MLKLDAVPGKERNATASLVLLYDSLHDHFLISKTRSNMSNKLHTSACHSIACVTGVTGAIPTAHCICASSQLSGTPSIVCQTLVDI